MNCSPMDIIYVRLVRLWLPTFVHAPLGYLDSYQLEVEMEVYEILFFNADCPSLILLPPSARAIMSCFFS